MKLKLYLFVILLSLTGFLTSCASPDPYVRSALRRDPVASGMADAITGSSVRSMNPWDGAAIGAAVSRTFGGSAIRNYRYYGGGGPYHGGGRSFYRGNRYHN